MDPLLLIRMAMSFVAGGCVGMCIEIWLGGWLFGTPREKDFLATATTSTIILVVLAAVMITGVYLL